MSFNVAPQHDIISDLSKAAQKLGSIYQTALDMLLQTHAAEFVITPGGDWVHRDTDQPLGEWIVDWAQSHTYCYADKRDVPGENDAQLLEQAMTEPTPARLAWVFKTYGDQAAKQLLADWQVDVARMKPGVRPTYAADGKTVVKQKASPKNPWSAAGWSLKAQGECVKALGLARAQNVAKSAGCKVGDTKPNRAYN